MSSPGDFFSESDLIQCFNSSIINISVLISNVSDILCFGSGTLLVLEGAPRSLEKCSSQLAVCSMKFRNFINLALDKGSFSF